MALPVASWVDQRNVGSAIDERFDQPNFKAHKNLESVLVNFLNDDDFSSQIKLIKENYAEDIKYYYLLPQLEIFKVLMKGKQIESFSDILQYMKWRGRRALLKRAMIVAVVQIYKLASPRQSSRCSNGQKVILVFCDAQSQNLAAS